MKRLQVQLDHLTTSKLTQEDARKVCQAPITAYSGIEAAASICFLHCSVQSLFEGGFYSRLASIRGWLLCAAVLCQ